MLRISISAPETPLFYVVFLEVEGPQPCARLTAEQKRMVSPPISMNTSTVMVGWLVGWLCFTSHRQRGHLGTAPLFTVPCEGRYAR